MRAEVRAVRNHFRGARMILFNYYYYLLIGGSHPVYSLYGWLQSSLLLLMKDLAAVEEAVGLGAKIYEGEISF